MVYKKSIVLSSVNGGKEKGVVTVENDAGELIGTVRLYNFNTNLEGILSLGILNGGEVLKAGLIKTENDIYTFKLNGNKDLNDFSCALVNLDGGEAKPLLIGSTKKTSKAEEQLCNGLCIFEQDASIDNVKKTLDENQIELEDQEEIEQLIDAEVQNVGNDNKCKECRYRDAFFKLEDDTSSAPEQSEPTFFDEIKEQIQSLFGKYPEEEILKDIIPNSKWVKIDYEDKGEYYVVGLLYEENKIKYVCYGVPSTHSLEPPEDLKGFSQWLPIDTEKEDGFGYWITYQDADTGENVKLDYETV
ncbi:MAG: hypothetical protein J6T74_00675 [Clostridia bacterium]|nr:hypothetical protein [Clostridia bacterium]